KDRFGKKGRIVRAFPDSALCRFVSSCLLLSSSLKSRKHLPYQARVELPTPSRKCPFSRRKSPDFKSNHPTKCALCRVPLPRSKALVLIGWAGKPAERIRLRFRRFRRTL